MTVAAIPPIELLAPQIAGPAGGVDAAPGVHAGSFADLLLRGVEATSVKLADADRLIAQAAVDDAVPLHQVTYAIEEARISFELMIQVRNRLLDASQQLMNMQV